MLTITVEGPEHSGKGHLMVLLAQLLQDSGIKVALQGAESHLKEKLTQSPLVHKVNLQKRQGLVVRIMEQQF